MLSLLSVHRGGAFVQRSSLPSLSHIRPSRKSVVSVKLNDASCERLPQQPGPAVLIDT